jgi:hypothetical protein
MVFVVVRQFMTGVALHRLTLPQEYWLAGIAMADALLHNQIAVDKGIAETHFVEEKGRS